MLGGEAVDEPTNVGFDLLRDHAVFHRALGETKRTEHVVSCVRLAHGLVALACAEMVDDLIVRDAEDPRQELAVVGVTTIVDNADSFDKGLLKDVVSHVVVLDHHSYVVANTVGVSVDKFGYGTSIT